MRTTCSTSPHVAARRDTLVRAAVLLGCSEHDLNVAASFYGFAQDPAHDSVAVPFAPATTLNLGTERTRQVLEQDLQDPTRWSFAGYYAGFVGPFSALETLAASKDGYRTSIGSHPTCAGPDVRPPTEQSGLRQISLQPRNTRSCMGWWSVALFLNDMSQIQAVTLTIWEP